MRFKLERVIVMREVTLIFGFIALADGEPNTYKLSASSLSACDVQPSFPACFSLFSDSPGLVELRDRLSLSLPWWQERLRLDWG